MSAGAGRVALHSAADADEPTPAGLTAISLEVPDGPALVRRLHDAGFHDATLIDESYGQDVYVTDPAGDRWQVSEASHDLYGFSTHVDRRPDPRVCVAPVMFADPQGDHGRFLEALGLVRHGELNPWFVPYVGQGQVGLHTTDTRHTIPTAPGQPSVHLTFTSTEPTDTVAARLRGHGHDVTTTREDFGSFCSLIDPDGQEIQVHEH